MKTDLQIEFWNRFLVQAKPLFKAFQNISPQKRRNLITSTGVPSAKFNVAILDKSVKVELTIYLGDKEENKFIYQELLKQKSALEAKFGEKLFWHNLEGNIHARIGFSRNMNALDKRNWQEMINFLIENYTKLENTFKSELLRINKL